MEASAEPARGGGPDWTPLPAASACHQEAEAVLAQLSVDGNVGLSPGQVPQRAAVAGPNELPDDDDTPLWRKYLEQYQDPMIGLLGAAAFISLLVGARAAKWQV